MSSGGQPQCFALRVKGGPRRKYEKRGLEARSSVAGFMPKCSTHDHSCDRDRDDCQTVLYLTDVPEWSALVRLSSCYFEVVTLRTLPTRGAPRRSKSVPDSSAGLFVCLTTWS